MNQLAMLILLAIVLIGSFLTINDVKYIEADGTTISGEAVKFYERPADHIADLLKPLLLSGHFVVLYRIW